MITTIAGGVGAARLLRGLVAVVAPAYITAVVNVADDVMIHGLYVCPDIDTVLYTLAEAVDPERGWGLADESWQAMESLERYGGLTWFRLGDRDLGTHLYRTGRLHDGADLTTVTGEIARAWGLDLTVLPATNDRLRTHITTEDLGEIAFQEYFVRERHSIPATGVRVEGVESAKPAPGVLGAIAGAGTVIIAPSNPIVSVDPVLEVPGIREAIAARRESVVAVSPIVGGRALKGPADRLMLELGHEPSAAGIARFYAGLVGTLVIDEQDAALAAAVEAEGLRCVVTQTVMHGRREAADLARACLEAGR
ncbi:MAG: 2-phospho-L-lactate transferase [Acidimicrobiales bacterium]|nr:MAG: 2-phospho-L-lactate transferase [Actinomycetota bacterium]MBV6509843.1 2-phospho-L-lactate transferase [Acidimicrobiales bacterium]RIK03364.1 MAG: 2-phospho-L-lactate transferase [Acidobacteriota bacterium]